MMAAKSLWSHGLWNGLANAHLSYMFLILGECLLFPFPCLEYQSDGYSGKVAARASFLASFVAACLIL